MATTPLFNVPVTDLLRRAPPRPRALFERWLPRSGSVRIEVPGAGTMTLRTNGDEPVANMLFWRGWGAFEPELAELWVDLARGAQVVLDVGAYTGFYAISAALSGPATAKVFAFEPVPTTFERLCENVSANGLKSIACVNAAVGDHDGTARIFHAKRGLPSMASMSHEFAQASGDADPLVNPVVETVAQLIRLDTYLALRKAPVDLVKIDTESTEPHVVRGMLRVIKEDRPAIACEVLYGGDAGNELDALLRPLGYRFYLLTDRGPLERPVIRPDKQWRNHLFMPTERPQPRRQQTARPIENTARDSNFRGA